VRKTFVMDAWDNLCKRQSTSRICLRYKGGSSWDMAPEARTAYTRRPPIGAHRSCRVCNAACQPNAGTDAGTRFSFPTVLNYLPFRMRQAVGKMIPYRHRHSEHSLVLEINTMTEDEDRHHRPISRCYHYAGTRCFKPTGVKSRPTKRLPNCALATRTVLRLKNLPTPGTLDPSVRYPPWAVAFALLIGNSYQSIRTTRGRFEKDFPRATPETMASPLSQATFTTIG